MVADELENTRSTLINLFTQKSHAHIGYLVATVIALLGARDIISTFHFNFFVFILMSLLSMTYFLLRAGYYSILIEAVMYVKTYTGEGFIEANKEESKKGKYSDNYDFSQLYLLKRAASEFSQRTGKYKNKPELKMRWRNYMARIFNDHKPFYMLIILSIILIGINYWSYYFYPSLLFA